MLKHYEYKNLGKADYGWLKTSYHFSFANYFNPNRVRVGNLRVLNDDYIAPHMGFDTHPHNDMEIITYVVEGELTHKDSMGNERTLGPGGVQYMSAGTGVTHSEYNKGDATLHLFQIWIFPDKKGHTPNYGDMVFNRSERHNKLLEIVSSKTKNAPIKINQEASIMVGEFDKGKALTVSKDHFTNIYLVLINGSIETNNLVLNQGDALESQEDLQLEFTTDSHLLIIRN